MTRAAVDRLDIRAFVPSDRDSVVRLMRELQQFERRFIPEHAVPDQAFGEWYVDRLLGVLREQDGVLLVATHNDAICGFGAGYVDDDPEARGRNFYNRRAYPSRAHARRRDKGRAAHRGAGGRRAGTRSDDVVIGVLAASERVHGLYARLGDRDHAIRMRKKLGPPA